MGKPDVGESSKHVPEVTLETPPLLQAHLTPAAIAAEYELETRNPTRLAVKHANEAQLALQRAEEITDDTALKAAWAEEFSKRIAGEQMKEEMIKEFERLGKQNGIPFPIHPTKGYIFNTHFPMGPDDWINPFFQHTTKGANARLGSQNQQLFMRPDEVIGNIVDRTLWPLSGRPSHGLQIMTMKGTSLKIPKFTPAPVNNDFIPISGGHGPVPRTLMQYLQNWHVAGTVHENRNAGDDVPQSPNDFLNVPSPKYVRPDGFPDNIPEPHENAPVIDQPIVGEMHPNQIDPYHPLDSNTHSVGFGRPKKRFENFIYAPGPIVHGKRTHDPNTPIVPHSDDQNDSVNQIPLSNNSLPKNSPYDNDVLQWAMDNVDNKKTPGVDSLLHNLMLPNIDPHMM